MVRQAARNKLTAIFQVLIIKNLLKGDSLYVPALGIMRSLVLAATKNNPPAKAPLLLENNPLDSVHYKCRQVLLIWMLTGVRYDGLFLLPPAFKVSKIEPMEWAVLEVRSKTSTIAKPRVFCVCSLIDYREYCPVCRREKLAAREIYDIAHDILKSLKCQKHTFRRSLAMGFVLGSKWLENSPISQLYKAWVVTLFGWSANGRSMLEYYTADRERYTLEMLPEIIRVAIAGGSSKPPTATSERVPAEILCGTIVQHRYFSLSRKTNTTSRFIENGLPPLIHLRGNEGQAF